MAKSLVALSFMPCDHGGAKKLLTFCPHGKTLGEVFEDSHGPIDMKTTNLMIKVGGYDTDEHATIGDIVGLQLGAAKTSIEFTCSSKPEVIDVKQIVLSCHCITEDTHHITYAASYKYIGAKTRTHAVYSLDLNVRK